MQRSVFAAVILLSALQCGLAMSPMAMNVAPSGMSMRRSSAISSAPRRIQRRSMCAAAIPGNSLGEEIIVGGLQNFFQIFNNLLIGRVLLSWFPAAQGVGFLQPLFNVCDPYLGLFRNIIPPIGGIDLSPVLAFTFIQVAGGSMVALGAQPSHAKARMSARQPKPWSFEAAANRHFAQK